MGRSLTEAIGEAATKAEHQSSPDLRRESVTEGVAPTARENPSKP